MNDAASIKADDGLPDSTHEKHASDLIMPISILVAVSVGTMYMTGCIFSGSWDVFEILQHASTYLSLCAGCAAGLGWAVYRYWHFHGNELFYTAFYGMKRWRELPLPCSLHGC